MSHRLIGFVDGENLVTRYQKMIEEGYKPRLKTTHIRDVLIWHPQITHTFLSDIVRLSYYQTVVGDDLKVDEIQERIAGVQFDYSPENQGENTHYSGSLHPKLFKKEARSAKTKSVDINLTVDVMRHAADPRIDVIFLLSGDGDYVPLLQEVARSGKQVWLAAFSSGLNRRLRYAADEFINLDDIFFTKKRKGRNAA